MKKFIFYYQLCWIIKKLMGIKKEEKPKKLNAVIKLKLNKL